MTQRFEDELQELDAAIAAASQESSAEHFGVALMRESLERRREILVSEAHGVLDLALRGDGEGVSGAEVSLVAGVLKSLQDSLASVAQVLAGEPTSRGVIPGAIQEMVALRIAGAVPGSLQLRLVPAHSPSQEQAPEPTLFEQGPGAEEEGEEELPLLDQSMDQLIRLLAYPDDRREDLLQNIAYLGPRTTRHLLDLSKTLEEAGANASLSWRSARTDASTTFTRTAAGELSRTLEEVQEDSREVVFTGTLVGGSLVHRTFELELEADGSVIAGKVTDDLLPELRSMQLGQRCTAHIQIREARLPSGETREAHTLTQLSE